LAQPLLKPLVGLFQEACELAANRQFYDFATSTHDHFGRDEQQLVAAFDRFGMTALILEHSHKQAPQIVDQQQYARRTLAHRRFLRTELGEAPLVL
jgi:hypothetical protein